MTNSVDLDETARYKLSHQALHCLQKLLFFSAGLKGLMTNSSNPDHSAYNCVTLGINSLNCVHMSADIVLDVFVRLCACCEIKGIYYKNLDRYAFSDSVDPDQMTHGVASD